LFDSFIFDLHDHAPALHGCVVVAIRRGDQLIAPTGSTTLQTGDVLTLLGGKTAVDAAQEKFI